MSVTKTRALVVRILIPIVAFIIWVYFFAVEKASLNRFFLTVALIPIMFITFYIAILVQRKIKQK